MERLLGSGTFGSVWSGTQSRTGLSVAVKVLNENLGSEWGSLQNEVRRLRELVEHPHIVSLLDADLTHNPPFFVMPWLKRGSLADLKEWVPLSTIAPAQGGWFRQLAQALQFTHDKGFLHCDLKPSNVLIDEQGHLRVVDFGQSVLHADTSVALGTLGWMAPEQGLQGVPSVRWDIYGLGATIYFLLTSAFPRWTPEDRASLASLGARQRLATYAQILASRPQLDLRRRRPDLDRDLVALVEACLALQPERRPSSAAEVLQDLDNRARRDPLLCRRPWSLGYRLSTMVRKPAVAVGLVGATALAGLASASYLSLSRANIKAENLITSLMIERGRIAQETSHFDEAQLWWAAALQRRPHEPGLRFELAQYPFPLRALMDTGCQTAASTPDGKYLVCGPTEPSPAGPLRLYQVGVGPKSLEEVSFSSEPVRPSPAYRRNYAVSPSGSRVALQGAPVLLDSSAGAAVGKETGGVHLAWRASHSCPVLRRRTSPLGALWVPGSHGSSRSHWPVRPKRRPPREREAAAQSRRRAGGGLLPAQVGGQQSAALDRGIWSGKEHGGWLLSVLDGPLPFPPKGC